MTGAAVIAGYALRESVRRKVLVVVLVLTAGFLALFVLACTEVFSNVDSLSGGIRSVIDARSVAVATMVGLGMFAILFLGAVLAVFLTLGAIRGDAERGLLQPLVVRPLGRPALLIGRFAAAAGVCSVYVASVYLVCVLVVRATGGAWPDRVAGPGLALVAGVLIIVAVALLGSVLLSATANGILVFMLFGAGLVAGLLSSIGQALGNHTLEDVAHAIALALPFEALYQAGLHALTADASGFTGAIIQLGPFGASHAGSVGLVLWALAYLAGLGGLALLAFSRKDL